MFERYTESARRALFFARFEASEFGARSIETEHLLLGLLREPQGLLAGIFGEFHLDPASVREEMAGQMPVGPRVSTSVELPFTAAVARALQSAASEAEGLGHGYIGTEHLLLGLLKERAGAAATVLGSRGLHLDRVRDVLVQRLDPSRHEGLGAARVPADGDDGSHPGAGASPGPERSLFDAAMSLKPTDLPNLRQAVPFFNVKDMEAALRFYVDGLGFTITCQWESEGQIRWCWVERGHVALMLQQYWKDGKPGGWPEQSAGQWVSICIMCADAPAVYREARARGLDASTPFVGNGLWVTSLEDPDGYRLEFESPADAPEGTIYPEPA